MFIVTPDLLTKISNGKITGAKALEIPNALNSICPKYGINEATVFHEFIANVLHESGCFTILSESLNYSIDGLLGKFSRERISKAQAKVFGRGDGKPANQQQIAEILYGGDWGKKNLGNKYTGDGYLFRGAGPIQITGRGNITNFTKYFNVINATDHRPDQMADLLRTDLYTGIHSACWIFAIAKDLILLARQDRMKDIVKKINGGYIGLPERMEYYELAKKFIF